MLEVTQNSYKRENLITRIHNQNSTAHRIITPLSRTRVFFNPNYPMRQYLTPDIQTTQRPAHTFEKIKSNTLWRPWEPSQTRKTKTEEQPQINTWRPNTLWRPGNFPLETNKTKTGEQPPRSIWRPWEPQAIFVPAGQERESNSIYYLAPSTEQGPKK